MAKIKLSGFADEIAADFSEQLRVIQELGIEYIEMRGVNGKNITQHSLEEVEAIKKQLNQAGVQISAIGSPIGKIGILDDFEEHFSLFQHTVEIAKVLNTSYIRLFSFYIPGAEENQLGEEAYSIHAKEVMDRMKRMVTYAEEKGIILLHENEKGIYGDVPSRCLELYQSMNSPNFSLIFDPANFVQCQVETYPMAFDLLKEHVKYYHIKDALMETGEVVPSGYGDGHLREILKALQERDFSGFTSLEPHLGQFEGFAELEGKVAQEADAKVTTFEGKSDAQKFKLAKDSFVRLVEEAGIEQEKMLRFGIVGIGNMGSSHAANLFEGRVQGAKLTAVCDHKEARRTWAEERFFGCVKTYDNLKELLQAQVVDAVLVATPHYDHPTMGIQVLNAGCHVLVEKPIGVYTKAVRELNQVAAKSDRIFGIMYNQRTNPMYRKLREMIQLGELGEIRRVNWIITDWYRTQAYYNSGGWRATWEGEGGGALINQCPHQLDLIQWLCGAPVKVRGFCHYGKMHNIEVEDEVTAYLEYANGASGVFITSTGEAPGTNRLEISGDMGKVVIENGEMFFYQNAISEREHNKTCKEGFVKPNCEKRQIIVEGTTTDHVGIMQDFTNAVSAKRYAPELSKKEYALIAPGEEGIMGLSLSNAIHLSSWTDQWVSLPLDEEAFYEKLQERINESTMVKEVEEVVFDVKGSH